MYENMSMEEVLEVAYPIMKSYSKKKCGRIRNKRTNLRLAIEGLGYKKEESDGIAFANWLRENEYSPMYGNTNWRNFSGELFPIEYLYKMFKEKDNEGQGLD